MTKTKNTQPCIILSRVFFTLSIFALSSALHSTSTDTVSESIRPASSVTINSNSRGMLFEVEDDLGIFDGALKECYI